MAEAIAIITYTKTYSEFPEISHWMDARRLYKQLGSDSVFRFSNDTLNDFYIATQNEILSVIENTDAAVAHLISGMESQDYELYLQRISVAKQKNSNIISEEIQEQNERHINEIYLKMLELGLDSLSSEDSSFINELANTCPYIGGTAVYKARSLYAMYTPLDIFNDIELCNEIGVYKTGNNNSQSGNSQQISRIEAEMAFLKSLKPDPEHVILAENDLVIYPNPTTNQVNIRYICNSDSKLQIVNMLGVIVKEIYLPKEAQHVSVLVSDLISGVYTYKQLLNQKKVSSGKLVITN